MKPSRVTDTALLQYYRAVCGLDTERMRNHIAAQLRGMPHDARKRSIGGIDYIIGSDGNVTGIYAQTIPEPRPVIFPVSKEE